MANSWDELQVKLIFVGEMLQWLHADEIMEQFTEYEVFAIEDFLSAVKKGMYMEHVARENGVKLG